MWSIITWKTHLSPRRITLRPRWHPPSPVKGPSIWNPPTFIGGARCTFVTWPNTEQDRFQCSRTTRHVQPCSRDHLAVDLCASGDDQTADLAPTDPILVRRDQLIATGTPLRFPRSAPVSVDTQSLRSSRTSSRTLARVARSALGTGLGAASGKARLPPARPAPARPPRGGRTDRSPSQGPRGGTSSWRSPPQPSGRALADPGSATAPRPRR